MSEGYLGPSVEIDIMFVAGCVLALLAGAALWHSPSNPRIRSWTDDVMERADRVGPKIDEVIDGLNRDPRSLPGQLS